MSTKRFFSFDFTINNYTDDDLHKMHTVFETLCSNYAAQEEIGPKSGVPHIQGCLTLTKGHAKTISALSKHLPRASIRKANNIYALRNYCTDVSKRAPDGRVWDSMVSNEKQWPPISRSEFLTKALAFYDRRHTS